MWSLLLALAVAGGAAPPDRVAVRINGEDISVAAIDEPSRQKIERLQAALVAEAARTVERLIDQQLARTSGELTSPSPAPVTPQAIRELRTSRAAEFDGPLAPAEAVGKPDLAEDAIRHLLRQENIEAEEAENSRRLRAGRRIRLAVPDGSELERPLPEQRMVAEIDGTAIQAAALEQAASLALYRLRKEIYLERMRHIEAAIEARLWAGEARRRGMSVEALLAEVTRNTVISDAEVTAYIDKARASGRAVANPERVRQYLAFLKVHDRRSALLEKLRKDARIDIRLADPQPPRLPIVKTDAPFLGAADGATLVAYTNYRCAPCRSTHREIDRLLAAEPKVRVVFRDFIPAYDPVAKEAARLSRCAARLGVFVVMRSELLVREPPAFGGHWYDEESLRRLAGRLKIDASALRRCLETGDVDAEIAKDTAEARGFGFEEAPSFVAQGIPLSGMQAAESFARLLHPRNPEPHPARGGPSVQ